MFGHTNKYLTMLVAALFAIALVMTAAVAVPRGTKAGAGMKIRQGQGKIMRQGMRHRAADKLGLTQEQKTQIQSIIQQHRGQIQQIMKSGLASEAKRAQAKAIRLEMKNAIEQVLTPEQREKSRQMFTKAVAGKKQMKQRFQQCLKDINLTQDQKDRIPAIKKAGMDRVRGVKKDATLSADQKMARIQAIRQETREQIKTVLTPEQLEKLVHMCPLAKGAVRNRSK